jgi:hypothetical protein
MQCDEFELKLHELLDERRAPASDAPLVDHALKCAECGELLSSYETLLDGLELLPRAETPEYLAQRVLAEVVPRVHLAGNPPGGKGHPTRGRFRLSPPTVASAIAASLLIVVGVTLYNMPPSADPPAPDSTAPVAVPKHDTKAGKTEPVIADRGEPIAPEEDLVASTARRVTKLWQESNVGSDPPEWLDPMARPLIPVKDSVSAAFTAIRKTLPPPPVPGAAPR